MAKNAFLFPGQGAQYPGMGKDFLESYSSARRVFEEADDILGRKLSKIILEGPAELLTETKNSQTGIYVVSVAILRTVEELFPQLKPAFCAGLSLGEYTAATCAGYLPFEKGLPLVQLRAIYMNEACESTKGAMAVVLGLDAESVEKMVKDAILPDDLWVANYNCPGQVVISGTVKGIELGSVLAKEKGAKRILPLQVHGAFHSGLMLKAERRLEDNVHEVKLEKPTAEIIMNVTGKRPKDETEFKQNLIKQVTHSVRWEQTIRELENVGITRYFEMGPGKTLSGFNKRIEVTAETVSIEKVEDLKHLEEVLKR